MQTKIRKNQNQNTTWGDAKKKRITQYRKIVKAISLPLDGTLGAISELITASTSATQTPG